MANKIPPEVWASLTGGASLPAFVGAVYGAAYYFEYPLLPRVVPAALILGGIASIICIQAMLRVFFGPEGRSWAMSAAAFSTFIPYFYSLFLMAYLGLWNGWRAVAAYHGPGAIVAALFWTLAGWRMLYVLGKISRKDSN
jgi:uncharacterized BrkB/YihY/UPF0761 family membrane protein